MNDIIKRWNDDINSKENMGDLIGVKDYILSLDHVKILDLKYLKEINTDSLITDLTNITKEINKKLYQEEIEEDFISACIDPYNKLDRCNDFYRCILCMLDYLIDIERIKIVKV